MTGIKHAFPSAKADGVDATLVRPSNWNADHKVGIYAAASAPIMIATNDSTDRAKAEALLSGGAVCGVSDNEVQINAALISCGRVILAKGSYSTGAKIVVPDGSELYIEKSSTITPDDNFDILEVRGGGRAFGNGCLLDYLTPSKTGNFILVNNDTAGEWDWVLGDSFEIDGFQLRGTNFGTQIGVLVESTGGALLWGGYIRNIAICGGNIAFKVLTTGAGSWITGLHADNIYMTETTYGLYIDKSTGGGIEGNYFTHCQFQDVGGLATNAVKLIGTLYNYIDIMTWDFVGATAVSIDANSHRNHIHIGIEGITKVSDAGYYNIIDYYNEGVTTNAALRLRLDNQTIDVAGAIGWNCSYCLVDTFGGAASDNLDTIATTGVPNGSIMVLQANDDTHDVVVRDHAVSGGNLHLNVAGAFTLDTYEDIITLIKLTNDWYEITRSKNG